MTNSTVGIMILILGASAKWKQNVCVEFSIYSLLNWMSFHKNQDQATGVQVPVTIFLSSSEFLLGLYRRFRCCILESLMPFVVSLPNNAFEAAKCHGQCKFVNGGCRFAHKSHRPFNEPSPAPSPFLPQTLFDSSPARLQTLLDLVWRFR